MTTSSNGAADSGLERHLRRLEALGRMPKTSLPAVAKAVEGAQHATTRAGTDPSGKPWPLTQAGASALVDAVQAVDVEVVSGGVVVRVSGPEALHDQGKARGRVRRQIIPSGAIPARMGAAIGEALDGEFAKITGGGS